MPLSAPADSSASPRTIVIVGGVAGGATAAARARRANEHARIILIEKDEHVSFANCGLPYYIGGEITDRNKLLVATPAKFRDWFNIEVRTRHEVLAIDRAARCLTVRDLLANSTYQLPYDRLILSPGASPIVPPLDGIRSDNIFTLRNLADTDRIFRDLNQRFPPAGAARGKAVVIGAGFIGLEMVEMLHRRGMSVALVELLPQVLPPLDPEMAAIVQEELVRHGVDLHLGNGLKAFETRDGHATHVVLNDGTRLESDFVMLCIGVRPNVKLAQDAGLALGATGGILVNDYLQTSDPLIYAAGDAVEYRHGITDLLQRIPLAGPANRAGRIAGEHAATDHAPAMPEVMGTAIVRVFDLAAAVTGGNQRMLAKTHPAARAVWLPANHHVSYYPGAQEMLVKLWYDPATQKVLGAQIVGGAGVDKRIDVIATVMHHQGVIDDLTELDLSYAPPFGAAKDPVHMAGFVAQNDLRQLDRQVAPADVAGLDEQTQVVDVRSAAEWNAGHLPRALWIPLPELRRRLGELDPSRPVVTVCRGGQRSYYATRLLRQAGFKDVRTLSGGMLMQPRLGAAIVRETAPVAGVK